MIIFIIVVVIVDNMILLSKIIKIIINWTSNTKPTNTKKKAAIGFHLKPLRMLELRQYLRWKG